LEYAQRTFNKVIFLALERVRFDTPQLRFKSKEFNSEEEIETEDKVLLRFKTTVVNLSQFKFILAIFGFEEKVKVAKLGKFCILLISVKLLFERFKIVRFVKYQNSVGKIQERD
jgi:hypothetical protein